MATLHHHIYPVAAIKAPNTVCFQTTLEVLVVIQSHSVCIIAALHWMDLVCWWFDELWPPPCSVFCMAATHMLRPLATENTHTHNWWWLQVCILVLYTHTHTGQGARDVWWRHHHWWWLRNQATLLRCWNVIVSPPRRYTIKSHRNLIYWYTVFIIYTTTTNPTDVQKLSFVFVVFATIGCVGVGDLSADSRVVYFGSYPKSAAFLVFVCKME